jgi:MtaA/CmuA family methyltransferase
MQRSGYLWPKAHTDAECMAGLAVATLEQTGIENVGVPFCMTVEAESMGSRVDMGSESIEPHVKEYSASSGVVKTARMDAVIESVGKLKSKLKDVPVMGNVVGPMTLAASVGDPLKVLRMVRTDPNGLNRLLDAALDCSIEFAKNQVEHGADVIVIGDPTATGEILGAKAFTAFEIPGLQKMTAAIHQGGAKVIVHICGNIHPILDSITKIGADALSFDSMVNIAQVRSAVGSLPLMGNISTVLLHKGTPAKIASAVRYVVNEEIDIVAPACGFSPFTPLANIQAMCRTVKEL